MVMVDLEDLERTLNLGDEMTPEREQNIKSMCYRQVSALKRESNPKDAKFFNEVLKSKEGKVTQGGYIKNRE